MAPPPPPRVAVAPLQPPKVVVAPPSPPKVEVVLTPKFEMPQQSKKAWFGRVALYLTSPLLPRKEVPPGQMAQTMLSSPPEVGPPQSKGALIEQAAL